jgi:hypothetical protein
MFSRRQFAAMCLSLLFSVVPVSSALSAADLLEPVVVVASASFPSPDISFADLKSAFRGQPITIRGISVVPINPPLATPLREQFDRRVLGLEPNAVGRYWVDVRIRDEGSPPPTASTEELALRVVAALPGAITYATRANVLPGLKVLTVDRKRPDEPGYALEYTRD